MPRQKDLVQTLHKEIKKFLTRNADQVIAKKYARYFTFRDLQGRFWVLSLFGSDYSFNLPLGFPG